MASSSSCSCSSRMRRSRSSYGEAEPVGLAAIPGRHVGAGEDVQPVELGPASRTYRRTAESVQCAVRVAEEPQVELDQARDRIDRRLVEPQRRQPLLRELRADHVVVVEADRAAGLEAAGGRLADVVQEGRQPQDEVGRGTGMARLLVADRLLQHGEAVLVDVLVVVVLVDARAAAPGISGSTRSASPVSTSSSRPGARVVGEQQLDSSSRTRSALTISIRSAIAVIAARVSAST